MAWSMTATKTTTQTKAQIPQEIFIACPSSKKDEKTVKANSTGGGASPTTTSENTNKGSKPKSNKNSD